MVEGVVQWVGGFGYGLSEVVGEFDCLSVLSGAVVDESAWDGDVVLFFEADGLCGELHFVDVVVFWTTVFVFHGHGEPEAGVVGMGDCVVGRWGGMEFDYVGDSVEAEG